MDDVCIGLVNLLVKGKALWSAVCTIPSPYKALFGFVWKEKYCSIIHLS